MTARISLKTYSEEEHFATACEKARRGKLQVLHIMRYVYTITTTTRSGRVCSRLLSSWYEVKRWFEKEGAKDVKPPCSPPKAHRLDVYSPVGDVTFVVERHSPILRGMDESYKTVNSYLDQEPNKLLIEEKHTPNRHDGVWIVTRRGCNGPATSTVFHTWSQVCRWHDRVRPGVVHFTKVGFHVDAAVTGRCAWS